MAVRRTYTDAERAQAVALYVEAGPTEASHRTGIPRRTIIDWATKAGATDPHASAKTAKARQEALNRVDHRRAILADGLMDDCFQLRAQLFAPCVERKPVTVSAGPGNGQVVEVVDIDRDRPTFAEQTKIMTSIAIAVDKIQLLTGEATERTETRRTPERTPEHEQELAKVLELVRSAA